MNVFDYKPLEKDYRIWLVLNPAVWLMPILFAVLAVALVVHAYAWSLGIGFSPVEAVAEAPAAVEAAPAAVAE
ncbi:light-harvesting antenna LH1, alpha subunit [Thiocapsa rosea]|uniref:Light-harvesting protein B-800-850 alpha chain n=1 Tax=Thiocapsa rosea TaxID=69360 RepID=A0A495V2P1_9GAMM|nr:light-harvesting antenna LH1, alpha subunit [Thiocapsa rosea]RKT43589.1 light-harvesting protein B-800-850 alpha chain [Thiocapsa rosea]